MCFRITNLHRDHRRWTELPNGARASPQELDARFADVPPEERGRMSRLVLASIPKEQRTRLKDWAGTLTKARPIPDGHLELLVFLAMCHATRQPSSVHATVNLIVVKQSCAGIILREN
jgi:hypothetical protein